MVKSIYSIPYESKYIIVSFEDIIPIKCVPSSFSFDKLTIIENFSSLYVGILSIENVPLKEQLIFSLSHRYICY